MEFSEILVVTLGMVVVAALIVLPRVFPRSSPDVPPPVPAAPGLTIDAVIVKIAEALKPLESENRMLRAEWADVFDKFKRMEARRYARQKRADDKEEEEVEAPLIGEPDPIDGVDVEVMSNRRQLGL